MKNIVTFTVPGEPVPKARPRFTRSGHAFTEPRTANYERTVRTSYMGAVGADKAAEGTPLAISIRAFFRIAKSGTKAEKAAKAAGTLLPTKRPDLDNVIKAILDALNGAAWYDDAQICRIEASKQYSTDPRVEVEVEEWHPV